MPQYLLSIYQSDNGAPGPTTMARIVADLHKLNDELRESGSRVFTGGLHAPTSATVVRADGMITDVASALAATDPDRAERIARSIPDKRWKARALVTVAESLE